MKKAMKKKLSRVEDENKEIDEEKRREDKIKGMKFAEKMMKNA